MSYETEKMSHEPEQSAWHTEEAEIPLLQAMPFSRPHVLQQIRGPGSPAILELAGDSLVVGRSPEAEIHIPSPSLSRTHMRLERYQGTYRVLDLDSSNGVYLNEIRVHSAVLRDGDTLQLGNSVFIYHEGK
jgi:pSer/pThr/pTyr-binding forkhead associated (FHA) protein